MGGVQRPVGSGGPRGAIAAAMASPFGGGPAAFRQGQHDGPADTVYLGVFDRDALNSVGGFDETLERNQDYELNWRLREQGHTVWLDSNLVVAYIPRADYAGPRRPVLLLRHVEAENADAPSPIAASPPAGRPGAGGRPGRVGGRTGPPTVAGRRGAGCLRGGLRHSRGPAGRAP